METTDKVSKIFVNFGTSLIGRLLPESFQLITRNIVGVESASDAAFNDSKFFGTIAYYLALGKHVLLDDAASVLAKKGGFSFSFHLAKRVPTVKYRVIVVDYDGNDPKVLSFEQCRQSDLNVDEERGPSHASDLVLTFGYNASFHFEKEETGHVTRNFGVSYDLFLDWLERDDDGSRKGKIFQGEILKFTVDGKKVGHVVSIHEMDTKSRKNSHITVRSPIKAVLSGAIVGKFEEKIFEFHLKDIDPNSKTDSLIKVESVGFTEVQINEPYVYAVEP